MTELNTRKLSFDMEPVKISALTSAAKISPQVKGPTIGPLSKPLFVRDEKPFKEIRERELNDSAWDNSIASEDSFIDMNSSINIKDIKSMTYKFTINELEKLRKDIVKKELEERRKRMALNERKMEEKIVKEAQENIRRKSLNSQVEYEKKVNEAMKEFEAKEHIIAEQERLKQLELKKNLNEKNLILKRQEEKRRINERIEAIKKNQERFKASYEIYVKKLIQIDKSELENFSQIDDKVRGLFGIHEVVIKSITAGKITDNEVKLSAQMHQELDVIHREFEQMKQALELRRQQKLEEEKQQVNINIQSRDVIDTRPPAPPQQTIKEESQSDPAISSDCLKIFLEMEKFRSSYNEALAPLVNDEATKQYRSRCHKALSTTLNTITAGTASELTEKYNNLASLLSGQPVYVAGVQISASSHPLGIQYCTDLLAKKCVDQSTKMVSNGEAIFHMAAMIVSLWHKYPEFGKLFLAHMYKECPYLVPCLIPYSEGQRPMDECAKITRLFGAIMVTSPRRNETNSFTIDNGWRWMSSLLNLEPLPDVCATIITEFLMVAGFQMHGQYGKQFQKLVQLIRGPYFEKLSKERRVVLGEMLLKFAKSGRFSKPKGLLATNFW